MRLLIWLAVFLCGCVSTRQFVPFSDPSKSLDDENKGRICVMRPAIVGSAIPMTVLDEGFEIGRTGAKGYLCWERPVGLTRITSTAENRDSVDVSVEKGMTQYIFQHVRPGFVIARTKLELITHEKALGLLKKCKRPVIDSMTTRALGVSPGVGIIEKEEKEIPIPGR